MKITATQELEISISEKEQERIALNYLFNKFDWKSEYFISEGYVYETVIYRSSHSFRDLKKIREATVRDLHIEKIIESIKTSV